MNTQSAKPKDVKWGLTLVCVVDENMVVGVLELQVQLPGERVVVIVQTFRLERRWDGLTVLARPLCLFLSAQLWPYSIEVLNKEVLPVLLKILGCCLAQDLGQSHVCPTPSVLRVWTR